MGFPCRLAYILCIQHPSFKQKSMSHGRTLQRFYDSKALVVLVVDLAVFIEPATLSPSFLFIYLRYQVQEINAHVLGN